MIKASKIAKSYGVTERTVLSWAQQHKISFSKIGNVLFIDEIQLKKLIELNTEISRYDEYLAEQLRIKEEEMTLAIFQIDDLIYQFKSIKKVAPILRLLIKEMSFMIPDELKKNIFKDVTLGKEFTSLAKKHKLTYDQTCYQYETALKYIAENASFLAKYRDRAWRTRIHHQKIRNGETKSRGAY